MLNVEYFLNRYVARMRALGVEPPLAVRYVVDSDGEITPVYSLAVPQ